MRKTKKRKFRSEYSDLRHSSRHCTKALKHCPSRDLSLKKFSKRRPSWIFSQHNIFYLVCLLYWAISSPVGSFNWGLNLVYLTCFLCFIPNRLTYFLGCFTECTAIIIFSYHHQGFEPMSAELHRPRTFWRTLHLLSLVTSLTLLEL